MNIDCTCLKDANGERTLIDPDCGDILHRFQHAIAQEAS